MQGELFERCTHFVLQCTVFERKSKHKTMSQPESWHGINFNKNNLWNILVIGKYYENLNAFNLLGYWTNTDASILVYKFQPKRTGLNMYAEYTRPQLNFLALHPCSGLSVFWKILDIQTKSKYFKRLIDIISGDQPI